LNDQSPKKVIVFIPALNEEETIGSLIDKLRELYDKKRTIPAGYEIEILLVNDGSTDKTEEIAISKGVAVRNHPANLGLGAATRTGMETAYEMGADIAIKLDADFQHDPADIEKVIMPIIRDNADICWGSRFAGKINYKMPLVRYLGNRFFTYLMNKLTYYKISDAQTGMMAFNRKYLAIFDIHGDYNPPQQLLVDASFKHMRYFEVPVVFHPRTTGQSFVNLKYPFYVFTNIFRLLIFGNPLKVFSLLGIFSILFSFFYFFLAHLANIYAWSISGLFMQNVSLVTMIIGFQLLIFGILADLIVKKRK